MDTNQQSPRYGHIVWLRNANGYIPGQSDSLWEFFYIVPRRKKLLFPWITVYKVMASELSVTKFLAITRPWEIEANTHSEYGKMNAQSLYPSLSSSSFVPLCLSLCIHTYYCWALCGWPCGWLSSHYVCACVCVHACVCSCACACAHMSVVWLNGPTKLFFVWLDLCLILSLTNGKVLAGSEHYLYHYVAWIYLNFTKCHSSWLTISHYKEGERSFLFTSIAILYLESFFLKLLPLAPVKQNIML